jgi:inhibitor of KinA sporulation pathway (predicted exonuclease)
MIVMSLDLEMSQPDNIIIQVGAAVGNTDTGSILWSGRYNIKSDTQVSPFITGLTGITQTDVDLGIPLQEAYDDLALMHKVNSCVMNPLVWGGGDMELLRSQLGMDREKWIFGRRFIDVKTVYTARQMARGMTGYGGLKNSMKKMGLKFEGDAHRAEIDAINTFKMYHKLLGEFK